MSDAFSAPAGKSASLSERLTRELPKETGVEFLFELGVRTVERQHDRADRLDAKAGSLWALLGAVIVWALGAMGSGTLKILTGVPLPVFYLGLCVLVAGFLIAFSALFPRSFSFPVDYGEILKRHNDNADEIKWSFLQGIGEAVKINDQKLDQKSSCLRVALLTSVLGVLIVASSLFAAWLLQGSQPIYY